MDYTDVARHLLNKNAIKSFISKLETITPSQI